MRLLLIFSFLIITTLCDVVEEVLNYSKVLDHFAVTTPGEKSEMIMNDLFVEYPSIKPATEKETKELKRSFMYFFYMSQGERAQIYHGNSTTHKVFIRTLKELSKLMKNEFDSLGKEDREYLGTVNKYVIHKLCVSDVLKVYKKKTEEYDGLGWTTEQRNKIGMLIGATFANQWGIDPEEIVKEWVKKYNPDHYEL